MYGVSEGLLVAGKSEGSEKLVSMNSFTYSFTQSLNKYLWRLSMFQVLLGIEQWTIQTKALAFKEITFQ